MRSRLPPRSVLVPTGDQDRLQANSAGAARLFAGRSGSPNGEAAFCVEKRGEPQGFAATWCARLDSNQRPTESELSGRQGRNPDFMRLSGTSHKISTDLQKPWKPLVRLGSHGFFRFWENSSQTVVRGGQKGKSLWVKEGRISESGRPWRLALSLWEKPQPSSLAICAGISCTLFPATQSHCIFLPKAFYPR